MAPSLSHFDQFNVTSKGYENVAQLEEFPFMYKVSEYDGIYVPNHWHDSLEILYIEYGHMKVELPDGSVDLFGHDFIIINSRDIHNTIAMGMTKTWILQLPPEFMSSVIPDFQDIRFENPLFPGPNYSAGIRGNSITDKIRSNLALMSKVYTQKNTGYICAFLSLLYDLLFLLDTSAKVAISPSRMSKLSHNREILSSVTEYVRHNYKGKITLADGARVAGLQQEYFCRFFKKYMGMSFMDYVNEVRFSNVYSDLIYTTDSVQDILANRGFTNYKLFMRMFKERYGTTPLQKRKAVGRG